MIMARRKKDKKGFFGEFKEFISKGSVLDLAVGIIIGGAFTAIVTALTTQILTPLINWALASMIGEDGLESARTILKGVYDETTKEIIWESSIYIDWGAFISAIINFILVALILFIIVKTINTSKAKREQLEAQRLEKYYEKHPEERPAPVEPGVPAPTQEELLTQIRDILKEKK
jgi:large conductance mechanosensitive channel